MYKQYGSLCVSEQNEAVCVEGCFTSDPTTVTNQEESIALKFNKHDVNMNIWLESNWNMETLVEDVRVFVFPWEKSGLSKQMLRAAAVMKLHLFWFSI